MRPIATLLLIIIACAILRAAEPAAALPDPSASLAPRDLITALAALRQPYAERPTDSDVTGRIALCYVGLCLSGSVREQAAFGPWLDYARVIVKERQAARGGKPPQSWAEAKPELWVMWLGGDAVATLAGLDAWPDAAKDPLGRALRAYASGERGELTTDDGPWARMALLWLRQNGQDDELFAAQKDLRLDRLMVECSRHFFNETGFIGDADTPLRQWVQDVAWMLLSHELTDASALPHLEALATAMHVTVTVHQRAALAQQIRDGARRGEVDDPIVFATCLEALELGLDAGHGLDGQPRTLVALGDIARWLADRSLPVLLMNQVNRSWRNKPNNSFSNPLAARCPDWPGSARIAVWSNNPDKVSPDLHAHLIAVLTAELTSPRRISPRALLPILEVVAKGPRVADLPRLIALLDQRLGLDEPAVIAWLADPCAEAGRLSLLAPRLRHAQTRAYRDLLASFYASRLRSGPLLQLTELKPTATWIDPLVDQSVLPWPHLQTSEYFAVVWHGWLNISQAGSYRLATESDDGSQLRVDDGEALDNSGSHGMQRRDIVCTLTAGWHAVTLEFEQGGGGAGCRLLWCPPAQNEFVVVPAAVLAHGADHAPGLSASGYRFADNNAYEHARVSAPSPAWVAAATDAGFYQLHVELCRRAWVTSNPTSARTSALILAARAKAGLPPFLPELRDRVLSDVSGEVALSVLLHCGNPDPEAAKVLVHYLNPNSYTAGSAEQDPDHLLPLGGRLRDWLSTEQMGYRLDRCVHFGLASDLFACLSASKPEQQVPLLLMGACALALGDLTHAHEYLAVSTQDVLRYPISKIPDISRRILEWALLDRMFAGYDPDFKAMQILLEKHHAASEETLVGRWLAGELPWSEVQTEAKQIEGDRLDYYRGLYELTLGQFDAAKTHFTAVVKDHPEWSEADTAAGLLAWLATLTPEQRAALPKAKPLPNDAAAPAPSNF